MKKTMKNANTALNAKSLATEKESLKASRTQARIKKCEIALIKGYKYDKASGEIIGQKGKTIKSKINGYTVISFMDEGCKKYLYATTFIEYILKNENEMISKEDLEIAKICVKPSITYLVNKHSLKKVLLDEPKDITNIVEQCRDNQSPSSNQSNDISFNFKNRKYSNKRLRVMAQRKRSVQINTFQNYALHNNLIQNQK